MGWIEEASSSSGGGGGGQLVAMFTTATVSATPVNQDLALTAVYDPDSVVDEANDKVDLPSDGYYVLHGQFSALPASGGQSLVSAYCFASINGAAVGGVRTTGTNSTTALGEDRYVTQVAQPLAASAGDELTLLVFAQATSGSATVSPSTFFLIRYETS